MKKLHLLVLRSFAGPFAGAFSVALFVLVLQFLAQYQQDIFGKGFGGGVIAQIFGYTAVQLTVLALPIAVLIASLSTMGKLGETYELAAMKSAGISLFRILRPLLGVVLLLTFLSGGLAWYVIPKINLKLYSLLYDVQQAKPQFFLTAGLFDYKFDGFTLYFARRDDRGLLHDLKIWDHSRAPQFTKTVTADSARMWIDQEQLYLRMTLYHGEQHETGGLSDDPKGRLSYSHLVFDSLQYKLDMSGFGLQRLDEQAFKSHQYMQTWWELRDTLKVMAEIPPATLRRAVEYERNQLTALHTRCGSPIPDSLVARDTAGSVLDWFPPEQRATILASALNQARGLKAYATSTRETYDYEDTQLSRFRIEWYLKYTLPLACVLMLFIGAPLGAIIRKGGLGMPTVVSVGFFILFYVLMAQGRKLAYKHVVEEWFGVWMPILVLAPISIYLTWQSATDSRLFDLSSWRLVGLGLLRPFLRRR